MRRTFACAAVLLLVLGCHKKPLPSPQYAEALGVFTSLVDGKGDEAWNDPEMDRVYALCNAVSDKSSDYEDSRKMMARIDQERARLAKGEAAPARPEGDQAGPPPFKPPPTPTEAADAGPAEEPPPAGLEIGTSWGTVQTKYGPCFTSIGSVTVTGQGAGQADGYEWAGRPDCPKSLASTADKLILVRDGKILMLAPKSKATTETFNQLADGGLTLPDGGAIPPPAPPAPPPAPVADAGP